MAQSDALMRSTYRVLKSQSGPPSVGPRHLEHASPAHASLYASNVPTPQPIFSQQETPCAYLTIDMQVVRSNRSFCDITGLPHVVGRKLNEIIAAHERNKVNAIQRLLEEERKEREPHYLPPIYSKTEEERVIQSIGAGPDDMPQFPTNRQEMFTFQGPNGAQRSLHVRLGLAKKESTYFVVLNLLMQPVAPPPVSSPMPPSPYNRDPQYGYQSSQSYGQPQPPISPYGNYPSQYNDPRFRDQPGMYRQAPPPASSSGSMTSTTPTTPSGSQQFSRPEYNQSQYIRQTPRSELQQAQHGHQSELQLPPIRSQPGAAPVAGQRDDRSGRLNIGGLLESPNPESHRRQQ
jgi:hypothetical protein